MRRALVAALRPEIALELLVLAYLIERSRITVLLESEAVEHGRAHIVLADLLIADLHRLGAIGSCRLDPERRATGHSVAQIRNGTGSAVVCSNDYGGIVEQSEIVELLHIALYHLKISAQLRIEGVAVLLIIIVELCRIAVFVHRIRIVAAAEVIEDEAAVFVLAVAYRNTVRHYAAEMRDLVVYPCVFSGDNAVKVAGIHSERRLEALGRIEISRELEHRADKAAVISGLSLMNDIVDRISEIVGIDKRIAGVGIYLRTVTGIVDTADNTRQAE